MLSPAIARELRDRGHDAESVAGTLTGRPCPNDIGKIITALEVILAQYPEEDDLANGESWL